MEGISNIIDGPRGELSFPFRQVSIRKDIGQLSLQIEGTPVPIRPGT